MLCNWCHKQIEQGQELKERGSGYGSFSVYEGTGGGEYSHQEGGFYHRLCYYDKQIWEVRKERDGIWKGLFWLLMPLIPVFVIIIIVKWFKWNALDKKLREMEEERSRYE